MLLLANNQKENKFVVLERGGFLSHMLSILTEMQLTVPLILTSAPVDWSSSTTADVVTTQL